MSVQPWEPPISRLEGALEQIGQRFGDIRAEFGGRFGDMRADFDARFGDMRADFDARFADMRADFNGHFADMRADFEARFAQVDARLGGLDRKIDGLQWRMTTLLVGTWITTILVVLLHH